MIRVWLGGSLAGVLALAALVPTAIRSQTGPTPAATAAVSPVQATKPIDRGRDDELIALLRRKVRYVFVIYQENRSFDSYFGTFPGADGLYSQPASQTRGFTQQLVNVDGSTTTISPFRIGPKEFAADTDDIDHSHPRIVAKMDIQGGAARMDQFALVEERKYSPTGNPSLLAKQFGELAMAHEDCDTVPFLWQYAHKFVLFDAMFQAMSGPSTPGNLEIIAAQAGQTQLVKHPDEAFTGNGAAGPGVPVLNDLNPLAGSPKDPLTYGIVPINPGDLPETVVQDNLTFATLPLTLEGKRIGQDTQADADPKVDLADVGRDIASLSRSGGRAIPWGWYEEGYDREPTDAANAPATGSHTSYVTHHNGPQYFGYIARNAELRGHLHGLHDLYAALDRRELPAAGGVYFVKGGFTNILGLKPADPDPAVQKHFRGDDDHPAYSDAEISEAMVAATINRIARSPYWAHSAIVITYDDSEGDYDHVPPPMRAVGPDGVEISDGPRVPLIVLSPYAKTHVISHELGDTASVPKFIDRLFDLTPLAELPDENSARIAGLETFGQPNLGPTDAETVGIGDLTSAFSRQRLTGAEPPLPPAYAEIPDAWVMVLPQTSGFGCRTLGLVPTDAYLPNRIPPDFNPRPRTDPSR